MKDWAQMTQEAKDLHGYQLLNRPKFHGVKRLFESMATFHMVRGMGKRAELFALVDVFEAGVREGQRMERAKRKGV